MRGEKREKETMELPGQERTQVLSIRPQLSLHAHHSPSLRSLIPLTQPNILLGCEWTHFPLSRLMQHLDHGRTGVQAPSGNGTAVIHCPHSERPLSTLALIHGQSGNSRVWIQRCHTPAPDKPRGPWAGPGHHSRQSPR